MVENKILRSVINDDHNLALEIWESHKEQCKNILHASRIKTQFFRILSKNTNIEIPLLKKYLLSQELEFNLKQDFLFLFSEKLQKANVKHILFKGAILSKGYYEVPSDRYFSDIDILISAESYNSFYEFLDENKYKHKKNIDFLDNFGYTRTALEIINIEGIAIDFHHRIFSKFYSKQCEISKDIFSEKQSREHFNQTTPELNLCIIIYHACVQNNFNIDPYYLVDIDNILKSNELDNKKLKYLLSKYKLDKHYKNCLKKLSYIKSKKKNSHKLFRRKNIFSCWSVRTQIHQFIDPAPYMNINFRRKNYNFFDFLKTKFKKIKDNLLIK